MLLLLQAITHQLPQINVTVQQPAGGIPEWVKILLSTLAGAVLAISMEYLKPWISRWHSKRLVASQLDEELMKNLIHIRLDIEQIEQAGKEGNDKEAFILEWLLPESYSEISDDRYMFYFERDKAVVYELDKSKHLSWFYAWTTTRLPDEIRGRDAAGILLALKMAEEYGTAYIAEKKLADKFKQIMKADRPST